VRRRVVGRPGLVNPYASGPEDVSGSSGAGMAAVGMTVLGVAGLMVKAGTASAESDGSAFGDSAFGDGSFGGSSAGSATVEPAWEPSSTVVVPDPPSLPVDDSDPGFGTPSVDPGSGSGGVLSDPVAVLGSGVSVPGDRAAAVGTGPIVVAAAEPPDAEPPDAVLPDAVLPPLPTFVGGDTTGRGHTPGESVVPVASGGGAGVATGPVPVGGGAPTIETPVALSGEPVDVGAFDLDAMEFTGDTVEVDLSDALSSSTPSPLVVPADGPDPLDVQVDTSRGDGAADGSGWAPITSGPPRVPAVDDGAAAAAAPSGAAADAELLDRWSEIELLFPEMAEEDLPVEVAAAYGLPPEQVADRFGQWQAGLEAGTGSCWPPRGPATPRRPPSGGRCSTRWRPVPCPRVSWPRRTGCRSTRSGRRCTTGAWSRPIGTRPRPGRSSGTSRCWPGGPRARRPSRSPSGTGCRWSGCGSCTGSG